jgi:RecA/RadA recombinase
MSEDKSIYFGTGCKLLDMVVGGNKGVFGFPAGKFVNIVGDRSSGKTFVSNEIIANAYYKYGKKLKWVYDDCESGYSFDTNAMYGFEIKPLDSPNSTTVEEAFCNISNFANSLKEGQVGIYVLDSLDGLTSKEQDDRAEERVKAFNKGKEFDKGSYGMGKAKYLSQEFFPQLCSVIQDKNILVIIVSQVRDNVEMFSFEKYSRAGGKAMDFYAHTVLWLATRKKIVKKDSDGKERSVGVVVEAKTSKSKTPRPFRNCMFTLIYDYGLDDVGSSIDYLFELRTEKGELNADSKSVCWSEGEKLGKVALRKWMKETDVDGELIQSMFEKSKFDEAIDFINSDERVKNLFTQKFGERMSRDELVGYIENNGLSDELERRVVEKWENSEDSVRTNRIRKYSSQLSSDC